MSRAIDRGAVFESLFPGWSNPAAIAAIVGLRVALNGCLVGVTATAAGRRASTTAVVAALTLLSAAIAVLALRPGVLGLRASYVELLLQVALLVIAGYAVYSNPSTTRAIAFGIAAVGATLLVLPMVPLYGEAFVAP